MVSMEMSYADDTTDSEQDELETPSLASVPRRPMSGLEHAAICRGLTRRQLQRLLLLGTPLIFLNLLFYLHLHAPVSEQMQVDLVELYSGAGRVAGAGKQRGLRVSTYEVNDCPLFEDVTSVEGFANMVHKLQCLTAHGPAHWGSVCSNLVFMSRSRSGRSLC